MSNNQLNQPSHLQNLNSRQLKAVTTTEGPLLIVAGAGAGKTRTITHRIVHLIKNGIEPQNILAVTFTNKAAKEMRERMRSLLNEDVEINRPINALASGMTMPFMATFHSLGVHILRENAKELGIPRNFTIFDRADSLRAIKNALVKLNHDPKQYEPKTILGIISKAKGNNMGREEFTGSASGQSYYGEIAASVWQEYEKALKKEGSLDFDDLLIKTHDLLAHNSEVREKYQKRWQYIHIDEYQDTNAVQYDLVRLLVGKKQNICVVGDGDQCVYTWRQAKPENINQFEKEFDNVESVLLEQNYRSTQNILAAANDIITKNINRKDKKLFTENEEGEKISIYGAFSSGDEARYITGECERLISDEGVSPRDIAVLYRANFQSRAIEEQFLYSGIPYQVLGTKFFDRKEVKDVLSYLRAALNPQSTVDMTRAVSAPNRGIGKMTLTKMLDGTEESLGPAIQDKVRKFRNILTEIKQVAHTQKPSETFTHIIKASGMEQKYREGTDEDKERLENLRELVSLATKYDAVEPIEGIEHILQDAALATDQDELAEDNNAVKLMTVHSSKGLEFDYVFVTGLEEGLFPHEKMGDDEVDDEEERRLFYVAITRAGKKLYLTHAMTRTIYGKEQTNIPSHFLNDLDPSYVEDARAVQDGYNNGEVSGTVDLIDF